ncbi:hypothetical protein [Companilactobacillus mishanensis]|uniref:hypothetical protein n=1 Tax=Companilactobacillus mishanensis TaxID=2486008 RepID=UPI0012976F74|nr:hypothetical protein [Companilactobacillus mishanensis]MQS88763.1 hypothetical protein [Companilactobacillus mishanensis]
MKKTIVTLMAAITLMGTATFATACSTNGAKTEQAETHSAKKITKDEIKGQKYVGVSKDNKDQYLTFFSGKDNKTTAHYQVDKKGNKKSISYFATKPQPKLVINKKNPKQFKLTGGMNVMSAPEFHYDQYSKKVGKTTIQTPDGKKWKLNTQKQSKMIDSLQKEAK